MPSIPAPASLWGTHPGSSAGQYWRMADHLNARALDQLRSWRGLRTPDFSIHAEMGAIAGALRAQARATGAGGSAWDRLAPADLRDLVTVVGIRRGALVLRPHSSAARYRVDQWLRQGGERALVACMPAAATRVKLST